MGVLDDGATGMIRTLCHLHTDIAKAPFYNTFANLDFGPFSSKTRFQKSNKFN
jgi:hypothetical protein